VGAHDRDHPSGQPGSDAEPNLGDRLADAGGLVEPGCVEKTHHPEGGLLLGGRLGCRAKRGI